MEKIKLLECINNGLSIAKIAKQFNVSKSTIRYWLTRFELKTKGKPDVINFKYCPRCTNTKPVTDFFKRKRSKNDWSSYCKPCSTDQVSERQHNLKRLCVEYKGGKCEICEYNKCYAALGFHHIDPLTKDFNLAAYKRYVFNDVVRRELDLCMLLCSNCHREEHVRLFGLVSQPPSKRSLTE